VRRGSRSWLRRDQVRLHSADDRARPARLRSRPQPPPARGRRADHRRARGPLRERSRAREAGVPAPALLHRPRRVRVGLVAAQGVRLGVLVGLRRPRAAPRARRRRHPVVPRSGCRCRGRAPERHGRGRRLRGLVAAAGRGRRPGRRGPHGRERRGGAPRQELRRARAGGAGPALCADGAPRGRDSEAPHAAACARPATRSGWRAGDGASCRAGS
jgi:hypothetical protein